MKCINSNCENHTHYDKRFRYCSEECRLEVKRAKNLAYYYANGGVNRKRITPRKTVNYRDRRNEKVRKVDKWNDQLNKVWNEI